MQMKLSQRVFSSSTVFRKAIAKSGLQNAATQSNASGQTDSQQPNSTIDWSENAQYGEHIWFEASVSGDFCYVGEQYCVAKSLVSSPPLVCFWSQSARKEERLCQPSGAPSMVWENVPDSP
uniref:Uncharacterized protein n=1 Tax=Xiphophorus couchianus TaxID=32473 RepID=A0A3B5MAQ8_9TELE